MVYGARKQSMARMETDYSKHTHFRLKIKWRLEHLGALGIMDESAPIWVCVEMNPFILFSEQKNALKDYHFPTSLLLISLQRKLVLKSNRYVYMVDN